MKKITFMLIAVVLLFALSACGPNYVEEFNAAVDGFNLDLADYNQATDSFVDSIDNAETADEVNAICDAWMAKDLEMLEATKGYLAEIEGYEEGISDKEAFNTTVNTLKESVDNIQSDIDAIPDLKEFSRLAYDFENLATEWESIVVAQTDELANSADTASLNAALDGIIATNNEYSAKMADVAAELGTLNVKDFQSDVQDVISEINSAIATISELNVQMEALKQ
ncbi:MAG: hypothetical protein AB1Z23_11370 [Eubacteriales bacterium]